MRRVERAASSSQDNHAINVVRAVAALLVVIGHVRVLFLVDYQTIPHGPLTTILYGICSLGHAAVIVFFVLSGFWVGGSVIRQFERKKFSWGDYGTRRLTRLWIVLLPALAATWVFDRIGIAAFAGSAVYRGSTAYDNVLPASHQLGVGTLFGNVGFLQWIRVPTFGTNGPLWSLAYEFWFYAWFPMLLLAALSPRWSTRALSLAAFGLSVWLVGFHVLAYFPLWLLGALVAWRAAGIRRLLGRLQPRMRTVLVGSAAVVTFVALLAEKALKLADAEGAPLIGVATALLLAVLITDLRPRRAAGRAVLRGLSSYAHVSYSLYAVHLPLVALLAAAITSGQQRRPTLGAMAEIAGVLVVVLAFAWSFGRATEAHTDQLRRIILGFVQRRAAGAPLATLESPPTAVAPVPEEPSAPALEMQGL